MKVKKIDPGSLDSIPHLSRLDTQNETHWLNYEPWTDFAETTSISFRAVHDTSSLFLQFRVNEKFTLAAHSLDGSPVYEDSCVEIFLMKDNDTYFNFEFNAIGTCLAEWGNGKKGRIQLSHEILNSISRQSSLARDPIRSPVKTEGWSLAISIPLASLFQRSLSGLVTTGNFYKCGSNLPQPHYFSWSKIKTPRPDFHRPEYFGEIEFE